VTNWLKISFLSLIIFTIVFITSYWCARHVWYASRVWYGDLRDYYPYGLYVKAEKLEDKPLSYTVLTNDTYIQKAITSGNLTWVQEDDRNSSFVNARFPDYILWLPNGNYYLIHQIHGDGIPESWNYPIPTITAAELLLIPWIGWLIVVGIQKQMKKN